MEYYRAHLLDATRPYPGMVEALDALESRAVALSVLTNKPVGLSRQILAGLGLATRFVDVVGGDSLPVRKPAPDGIEHLRALTGTARDKVLLVGDSPVDVHTARAARVAFCGVSWGLVPEVLLAAAPERVIDTPAELIGLI
jgi:phosphoglycolate phosphatase